MKSYANITCGVLSSCDLVSRDWANKITDLFERHPWVSPTHAGNEEPIRQAYIKENALQSCWRDPFLWRNNKTGVQGSIWFGRGMQHSCMYVSRKFGKGDVGQEKWISFLDDACGTLPADLGYVHITTDAELNDPRIAQGAAYALDRGITTHDLKKGLPNLGWVMVLGAPYGRLSKHLLEVAKRDSLLAGSSVQLTPNMSDVVDNYEKYSMARNRVKASLGEENFWKMSGRGLCPDFHFKTQVMGGVTIDKK